MPRFMKNPFRTVIFQARHTDAVEAFGRVPLTRHKLHQCQEWPLRKVGQDWQKPLMHGWLPLTKLLDAKGLSGFGKCCQTGDKRAKGRRAQRRAAILPSPPQLALTIGSEEVLLALGWPRFALQRSGHDRFHQPTCLAEVLILPSLVFHQP